MLTNTRENSFAFITSSVSDADKMAEINLVKSMMIGRVEALARSIISDYKSERRGFIKNDILQIAEKYLIADPTDKSFSSFHRSCMETCSSGLEIEPSVYEPISASGFEMFLKKHGPVLIEEYKDGKWRGITGCGPIAQKTLTLLNGYTKNMCSDLVGISHHAFVIVLVESQPYWLDFTFDQFLDYERVRNWRLKTDEPVSYAGVLIMPIDRMTLMFNKQGALTPLD